jgi:hypothetical protein
MTAVFMAWLLTLLLPAPSLSSLPQSSPDLDTVLERATRYVTQYEAELGNLIGSENYVQSAVWLDNGNPPRVARRMQRRILSDFLIIQVGPEWTALRKVNQVDGSRVKEVELSFEDAFDNSPEANAKRLESMRRESTEYNIGEIRRDINLPTFALKVLRQNEVSRFSFERAGSAKVEGIPVWTVRFQERSGRSLVAGINGQSLYSKGSLWIEPETGRVLQTEFEVENPYTSSRLKGRTVVTYAPGKKIEMLVPDQMVEHYESQYITVDCRADYSNFRPFEVEVKFEIANPQP